MKLRDLIVVSAAALLTPMSLSAAAAAPSAPAPSAAAPRPALGAETQEQTSTQVQQPGPLPSSPDATDQTPAIPNPGSTNLPPTSRPGSTNRVMSANTNAASTSLMKDQAVSESDRPLLTQIRQTVFGQVDATDSPVHFILLNGAVRLVGVVPSMQEKRRIELAVEQVPGVSRVYNALSVGGGSTPGEPGGLTPTGRTNAPAIPENTSAQTNSSTPIDNSTATNSVQPSAPAAEPGPTPQGANP